MTAQDWLFERSVFACRGPPAPIREGKEIKRKTKKLMTALILGEEIENVF